jgi:hypothetical protein
MIETSENIADISAAFVLAQAGISTVHKGADNPYFGSKYADLAAVREAIIPHLNQNGISVIQSPGYSSGVVTLTTRLLHVSGQWIQSTAGARPAKDDPQGYGSTVTYLRRYSLAAVAGLAQADDDGHAASTARKIDEDVSALIADLADAESVEAFEAAALVAASLKKQMSPAQRVSVGKAYKEAEARCKGGAAK